MIPFTFRQLQVFVNTARFQSLSKAAEKCFITQAAASMSLIQLEQILDKPLFDRIGKRLHLNANGERLLPLAASLLSRAEVMKDDAFLEEGEVRGYLRIGASTTIANYLLPKLLASFKKEHPFVSLELIIDNSSGVTSRMQQLDIDIGFVEGDVVHHNLICNPWMEDELLIVCRIDHPISKQSHLTQEDLTKYRWLFREKGSGTRAMFYKAIQGDEHLDVEIILNSSEAMLNYLINSDCLSYLSKVIYENRASHQQLSVLSIENFQAKRHFYQLQNPGKYQSRVSQAFLDFLSRISKEGIDDCQK